MSPRQSALILWDIDHTLVTIGTVSREIYEMAFEEVVGRPLRKMADMTGRTEWAILAVTLGLHGVSDPESKFDDFYAALGRAADKRRERMRIAGRRLPGAVEVIAALAEYNVVQSVVTGNIKPVAVTKLDAFQLSEHMDLEVGGYGSDGDTRPPLIRQAWQRAQYKYGRNKYGRTFGADRLVVVGDTPLDVAAAREVGVHAVGVATGSSTVEDLIAAQASIVLPNLVDTELVMRGRPDGSSSHN